MSSMTKCQEKWTQADQGLFIDPLKQKESLAPSLCRFRTDRTASGAAFAHSPTAMCPSLKQIAVGAQQLAQPCTDTLIKSERTHKGRCPIKSRELLEPLRHDQTRLVLATGRTLRPMLNTARTPCLDRTHLLRVRSNVAQSVRSGTKSTPRGSEADRTR
jgi:hypothetical protein